MKSELFLDLFNVVSGNCHSQEEAEELTNKLVSMIESKYEISPYYKEHDVED